MLLQSVFTKSRLHQITKSVSADIISRASIKICNYLNIQVAKLIHLNNFVTQRAQRTHTRSQNVLLIFSPPATLFLIRPFRRRKKNIMICRIAETLNNDNHSNAKRHDESGK